MMLQAWSPTAGEGVKEPGNGGGCGVSAPSLCPGELSGPGHRLNQGNAPWRLFHKRLGQMGYDWMGL